MASYLRPGVLLQEGRTVTVSSDNGTITPLPIPQTDFWDINSDPNPGLTLVYEIINMAFYQGRVIYVNKTQDTTGSTIRLSLPGGYTFTQSGTNQYTFPDNPVSFTIKFSSASIVSNDFGGPMGPPGPPGPLPDPMEPTTLGIAYGKQDPSGDSRNIFGYGCDASVTRGNVIAQGIPTGNLTGDKSNVIASFNTLQGTNNIIDSNVIVSGDGSEVQNVNRSTLIGQGFQNPNDYNNSLYIGDMINTTPKNYSMCLNTNYYGGTIEMANESAYIGFAGNNITLNPNEVHLDFRAPKLYYHDLGQASTPNALFYDPSTSRISHDTLPNNTLINYQVDDAVIGNKTISKINGATGDSYVICSSGPEGIDISSQSVTDYSDINLTPTNILASAPSIELQATNLLFTVFSGGTFKIANLIAGTTRDHFLQFNILNGEVGTRTNFFQRKGTVLNALVPSGTANATVYGLTALTLTNSLVVGDQIKGEYSITGYSNVTNQSRINLPDGSFVSLPATCDGSFNISCTARSLAGVILTWVYIIEFGLIGGGGVSRTKGTYTRSQLLNNSFSLQTEMITTANLTLDYAIVNVLRA